MPDRFSLLSFASITSLVILMGGFRLSSDTDVTLASTSAGEERLDPTDFSPEELRMLPIQVSPILYEHIDHMRAMHSGHM